MIAGASMLWLCSAMLALMGVPLALLGFVFGRRHAGFNRRAARVEGAVVANREHRSTSGSFHRTIYFPTVRYTTGDGQELEAAAPGEREALAIGTRIALLYDPKRPDQVSFTGPRGSAGVARGIGGLGCLMVLAALGTACLALVGLFV